MSEQKWQRSSLRHLMDEMERIGHWISHTTIARLLKENDTVAILSTKMCSKLEFCSRLAA